MFITRRKLIRFVPFLAAGLAAKGRAESLGGEDAGIILDIRLHDEVSIALLKTYARSLALDNEDGHTRLTRGKNYVLCGGSQDTHAVMQETAVKVNEHLDRRGKRLEDVSIDELRDICHDARDSAGKA